MKNTLKPSELVLASDGSLYHIRLFPEEIAEHVILVGDPERVSVIASLFDTVEYRKQNREMCSCTGVYNNKRLTVLSTGMGTDNLDIVITELDAAVNIDLQKKELKTSHKTLQFIRLGTSGAIQPQINAGDFIVSDHAIGIDGLLYFYEGCKKVINERMTHQFINQMQWDTLLPTPYSVSASEELLRKVNLDCHHGITVTSPGFYGPQGREIRLKTSMDQFNNRLLACQFDEGSIMNFEMETSALYGLSKLLGHNALTVCLAIANRNNGTFLSDYSLQMKKMILHVLNKITEV